MTSSSDSSTSHAHLPKKPATIHVPLVTKLAVAAAAGIVGTSVIYPIDIVKTKLQQQTPDAKGNLRFKGPLDAFRAIVAKHGPRGLYRGLGANLVGVTPEKAIKLTVNDVVREHFERGNNGKSIQLWQEVVAGCTAGMTQVLATNPMEIVKIRLQTQPSAGSAAGGAVAAGATSQLNAVQVVQKLGIRGLYQGSAATLLRDVPFSAVFFPLYANVRAALASDSSNPSLLCSLGSGTLSGMIAAAMCTPADVVKTRLQLADGAKYQGVRDCISTMLREESPTAFFKGVVPRAMVVGPLFGVSLLSYEALLRFQANRLHQ